MSVITHHPDDALLLDHYHGRLADGPALLVAAHLGMCPHCRFLSSLFDAVGGALLEEVTGVALSDEALDLALARIERPTESEPETAIPADTSAPLRFLQGFDLPECVKARVRSRYWAAPGVWVAPIRTPSAPAPSKTYLMNVAPGMVMPEHDHQAVEMTLVLQGGFSDVDGDYTVGDFIERAPGEPHSPSIDAEGCLSLITHAKPIRPLTWLGILLKPFARI